MDEGVLQGVEDVILRPILQMARCSFNSNADFAPRNHLPYAEEIVRPQVRPLERWPIARLPLQPRNKTRNKRHENAPSYLAV
jgi:hypothetical protein